MQCQALPLTDWERVAGFVTDVADRRTLRVVSRTCKEAIDNTTTRLTVLRSGFQQLPEFSSLLKCTCIQFLDDLESSPGFKMARFLGSRSRGSVVFISGEASPRSSVLQSHALEVMQSLETPSSA